MKFLGPGRLVAIARPRGRRAVGVSFSALIALFAFAAPAAARTTGTWSGTVTVQASGLKWEDQLHYGDEPVTGTQDSRAVVRVERLSGYSDGEIWGFHEAPSAITEASIDGSHYCSTLAYTGPLPPGWYFPQIDRFDGGHAALTWSFLSEVWSGWPMPQETDRCNGLPFSHFQGPEAFLAPPCWDEAGLYVTDIPMLSALVKVRESDGRTVMDGSVTRFCVSQISGSVETTFDLVFTPESTKPACDDDLDNDGDGAVDFAGRDPGCASAQDDSELGDVQCDNGGDDDGDGFIDVGGGDPDCEGPQDDAEDECAGNPSGAALLRCNWLTILAKAQFRWQVAKEFGPVTQGLYHQVFNLVCAAGRMQTPECRPMRARGYRGAVGARNDWSDDWVYLVFKDYMKVTDGQAAVNEARAKSRAAKLLKAACRFSPNALAAVCNRISARDVGTSIAGLMHYIDELKPSFKKVTKRLLKDVKRSSTARIQRVIREIRYEHRSLFCNAVIPGFKVVAAAGDVSAAYARLAIAVVPRSAFELREHTLKTTLKSVFGKKRGAKLYKKDKYKKC